MLGTRGIYHDGWKAASVTPAAPSAWGDFANQRWELFNAEADPSECHDLAEEQPEKLQELIALWWAEAGKYGALPLESRDAIGILLAPRPQLSKPRDRYVYYPDCAEVPESVTPNIRNRSYDDRGRGGHRHAGGRAASCSRRDRASAATRSTSRTASSSTSTTWSASSSRSSSRPSRSRPASACSRRPSSKEGDAMPTEGTLTPLLRRREGRRGEDQDPARQVLARGRRAERRQGRRRAGHRRLPRHVAVGVRRRDDPPGDDGRRRRAVGRSRDRARRRVRARLGSC